MSRTIKRRLDELEAQTSKPDYSDHDYEMVITWGDDNNIDSPQYYKDGQPITRDQYQAEAPPDREILIDWGTPIPKREDQSA